MVVADDFGTDILERDRTSRDRYITLFILAVMAAGMLVLHMRVATSSVFAWLLFFVCSSPGFPSSLSGTSGTGHCLELHFRTETLLCVWSVISLIGRYRARDPVDQLRLCRPC